MKISKIELKNVKCFSQKISLEKEDIGEPLSVCALVGEMGRGNQRFSKVYTSFLSFIHGKYPEGKTIENGENDIVKAYEYALRNDRFSPYNPNRYNCKCIETPQINCSLNGKIKL